MAPKKMPMKKTQDNSNKKSAPSRKGSPGTRFTVDDPVNDIHDDELYDEETGMTKEPPEKEEIERAW